MNKKKKLHRNLLEGVRSGLDEIIFHGRPADKVLEALLKSNPRWGVRDRGFVAEAIYELIRYQRRYLALAGQEQMSPDVLYLLIGTWARRQGYDLGGLPEFEPLPDEEEQAFLESGLSSDRAVWESVPDWLDRHLASELGEEVWDRELKALNVPARMVLRTNRLKTDPNRLYDYLQAQSIPSSKDPELPDALILDRKANVFALPVFKKGWFEMQDGSSQRVGIFLEAESGMRVIDACAGAGGKTLQLASIMRNSGQIIALDVFGSKLEELKRRSRRAGAHNIETRLVKNTKVVKRLSAQADRLLLDVPCSGLGVLRRNPDTKWKLRAEFMEEVKQLQARILQDYSAMLRMGGKLVYATCSILPEENEKQVQAFLQSEAGQQFILEEERYCWPSVDGYDGFYMARLRRTSVGGPVG